MDNRIGTCSECGGAVVVPMYSVNPTPHCEHCGAIPMAPHGPVIPMRRPGSVLSERGTAYGGWRTGDNAVPRSGQEEPGSA